MWQGIKNVQYTRKVEGDKSHIFKQNWRSVLPTDVKLKLGTEIQKTLSSHTPTWHTVISLERKVWKIFLSFIAITLSIFALRQVLNLNAKNIIHGITLLNLKIIYSESYFYFFFFFFLFIGIHHFQWCRIRWWHYFGELT